MGGAAVTEEELRQKIEALADKMETPGYQSDSDGWGHVSAREIREVLGITPACRCEWNV